MTLSADRASREFEKFVEDTDGSTAVRVLSLSGLINFQSDAIAVTYPSAAVEVYTYKTGGLGGTTVATITVTYTSATKEDLLSVERT